MTSVSSVTKLFTEMKKHDRKRLLNKIGDKSMEKAVLEFQKLYNTRSLKNHLESKYELNEENVQIFLQECLKLRLPFEDIMSTYFSTKHSIKSLCVEEAFCYKHRTEQEFAAGSAICDMLVNEHGLYDLIHEDSENISCCFTHVLP